MIELGNRRVLQHVGDLPAVPRKIDRLFMDCETTAFDDRTMAILPWNGHRACGWAFTWDDCPTTWYLPVRHVTAQENVDLHAARRFLGDLLVASSEWVNHHVKFDASFAVVDGIPVDGVELHCTLTGAKMLDTDRFTHGLKRLTRDWLGREVPEADRIKAWLDSEGTKNYARPPSWLTGEYACEDVENNRALYWHIRDNMPAEMARLWQTERALTKVLLQVEELGMRIDVTRTKLELANAVGWLWVLGEKFREITGEYWSDSPKLIGSVLNGQFGMPVLAWNYKDGRRTGPSFDKDALVLYAGHPLAVMDPEIGEIVTLIRELRRWSNYRSLFLEPFLELNVDGVLHPQFNQLVRTGRMSCAHPNSQQFDDRAAALVVPRDGRAFLCADMSQGEFRLIVHAIRDHAATAAYRDDPRTDFHQWVADQCGVGRTPAKTLNFSMAYGAGERNVTRQLMHDPSIMEDVKVVVGRMIERGEIAEAKRSSLYERLCRQRAKQIYDLYHSTLPGIRRTARKAEELARTRGWIGSMFKRRRHLPSWNARKAFNSRIQGECMDVGKDRMASLCERGQAWARDWDMRLICNKHDELLFEGPLEVVRDHRVVEQVKRQLSETYVDFRVPVVWDAGVSDENWLEAKRAGDVKNEATRGAVS